jgi:hypothetical protein
MVLMFNEMRHVSNHRVRQVYLEVEASDLSPIWENQA